VSPRSKTFLRVVGYTFVGIAIFGFALEVALKVLGGKSLETYRSGTMIEWSYGAALVTIITLAFAGIVAVMVRVGRSVLEHREFKRLARAHGGSSIGEGGGTLSSPNKSLERSRGR
jgi:hypothetical protein